MNYNINFNCKDLKIVLSNFNIKCCGTELSDSYYSFDMDIEDSHSSTIIKQKFNGDLTDLIGFCNGENILNSTHTDCSLEINFDYSKPLNGLQPFAILKFETDVIKLIKEIGYCKEELENFKLELKSIFEHLFKECNK